MHRFLFLALAAAASPVLAATPLQLPDVVVTPTGREQPSDDVAPSLSLIDRDAIATLRAIHPSELRHGVPGLWISRGNGQEHLIALRSPVLTGAGACGAFLYLDNGVPVRPAGLCNVNQLIELNLEQSDSIEVLRGPGPVMYGSNALHGVIHSRSNARTGLAVESTVGPDDFVRATLDAGVRHGAHTVRARILAAHDGGFRADSGYGLGKLNLDWATQWRDTAVDAHLTATLLNQETASFILGRDAFAVPEVARSNANPEAYRDADSVRLSATIDTPNRGIFRPFLRRSSMTFLQHFLPGQPTEENGQRSAGLKWQNTLDSRLGQWDVGADIEWADIELRENQSLPVAIPSAFLQATRPVGAHYDFDVQAWNVALFAERALFETAVTSLRAGLRVERTRYQYRNALEDGNNDENGEPCGFGGCLFTRPADRNDTFNNIAPKLEWSWSPADRQRVFASLKRGFRAPQVTELYRLQSGQNVADLSSETLDAVELGWRGSTDRARTGIAAFAAIKRDQILRDADGFNVSQGKTLHYGLELDSTITLSENWTLSGSATLARHRYRFERNVPGSEPIRRGDDVDTAPRAVANVRLAWSPTESMRGWLEWEHMSRYFLDAANAHRYAGHDLLHGVWESRFKSFTLGVKIRNLLDEPYAERADFAFGNYRYFPGQPRSVFISLRYEQ
ncbi:MAG: TonB-dependent receptor [Gammaproteobacteria bacterium]